MKLFLCFFFFFFNDTATTEIYTLSLHDALPICARSQSMVRPNLQVSQAVALRQKFRSPASAAPHTALLKIVSASPRPAGVVSHGHSLSTSQRGNTSPSSM